MPPEPSFSVKKLVAMTPEMAEQIAAFRFQERFNSESAAIRRLIEAGLRSLLQPNPKQ